MKVLVLGFSVTAENPGYVEKAMKMPSFPKGISISKAGLGGVQPYHLRHIARQILQERAPDLVVLELSTPGFRDIRNDPADHEDTVMWLLHLCQTLGIGVCILDLPRTDVNTKTDWAIAIHRRLAKKFGIKHAVISYKKSLLQDVVHPTPSGKTYYARTLINLLKRTPAKAHLEAPIPVSRRFGCLPAFQMGGQTYETRLFSRGGYDLRMVRLKANQSLTITMPDGFHFAGLSMLNGPRTGTLRVSGEGFTRDLSAYDQFCYYERLGMIKVDPVWLKTLTITQLPDQPTVKLLKGEVNTDDRVGYIGQILYELRP